MESGGVPQPQPAPQVVAQAHQQQALAQIYGQAFLHLQETQLAEMQWRLELSAKLSAMLETLRSRNQATANICLCQTWLGADGCEVQNPNSLEVTLWADPRLGFVLDPLFQELRVKSCQGPVFFRNSMPGKVWRSGAVQIVQNLRILPPTLHPRSQLSEEALERLAEALYIPIYDLARPLKGQVCVLEVLLSTRATEAMLVADVISFIGSLLTALHLSLANPIQPPIRRSVLCGRRARAPDSDGEGSDGERPGPARAGGSAGPAAAPQPHLPPPAAGSAGQAGGSGAAPASVQQQTGGVGGAPATTAVQAAGVVTCGAAAAAAAVGVVARGCCPATGPATSEQPTLPASPSPERLGRMSEAAAGVMGGPSAAQAAAGQAAAGARTEPGPPPAQQDDGAAVSALRMPRKVRKVLDGAMQRSKSVVSVAALSHGMRDEDEEEAEGRQAEAAAAAAARTAVAAAAAAEAAGAAAAAAEVGPAGVLAQPTGAPSEADT